MTPLKAALYYAKQGWYVFPLAPGSKQPLNGSRGLSEATRDEGKIREWWGEIPQANVAVNCGMSGLVVLDVDTKDGKIGAHSLMELIKDDFSLISTLHAKTWSGGSHYFFKGTCDSSASKLAKDLDIKGNGGYVVLYPSTYSEKGKSGAYTWDKSSGEEVDIAPFPEIFRPKDPAGGRTALINTLPEMIPDGQKDDALASRAGQLRRLGLSEEELYASLSAMNQARISPPKPDSAIRRIAKSYARYAPNPKASALPPAPPSGGYGFRTAEQLREEASERVDWIVEDLIRSSGIALLSAKPGAGKSTLMRTLAASVANGEPFLSRKCKKGVVGWIGLEESTQDLNDAIEEMGLLGNGNILYAGQNHVPPKDRILWLEEFIKEREPAIIIVDTLAKFFEITDINHYTEVGKALEPLLRLRSRYGTCFFLIHHNSRNDTPLGSIRIEGDIDHILSMTVSPEKDYFIKTLKIRRGVALEETKLTMDEETRYITSAEPKHIAEKRVCERNILSFLGKHPGEWFTAQQLVDNSGRRGHIPKSAIDVLLADGMATSRGDGKRGSPREYSLHSTILRTAYPEKKCEESARKVRGNPEECEDCEESEPCGSSEECEALDSMTSIAAPVVELSKNGHGESGLMAYALAELGEGEIDNGAW